MARVTVEDCAVVCPNRFELVVLATHRARELGTGARATIPGNHDKATVIALREIADSKIALGTLNDSLVRKHQRVHEIERLPDDDRFGDELHVETDGLSSGGRGRVVHSATSVGPFGR